jgi:DNA-binding MarR family transcriptional regulator
VEPAALDEAAATLLRHSAFADARLRFCSGVSACWAASALRRRVMNDVGTMGIAVAITAMNRLYPEEGAQPEALVAAAQAAGVAGRSRVRDLLERLEHHGAVLVEPHPVDRRRQRLRPTAALVEAQVAWVAVLMAAVGLLMPLPPWPAEEAERQALAQDYAVGLMQRHLSGAGTAMRGMPEIVALMARRHGYVLMLELAASGAAEVEVNRVGLAGRLGISASHVARMLADAEQAGWLARLPGSSLVRLEPSFAARLQLWVARELALAGLWRNARAAGGA